MTPNELEIFARDFLDKHREDPLGPVATRILWENDRVRIWELCLEPGEHSALHRHELDYLITLLEGDLIAAIPAPDAEEKPIVAAVRPGRTRFMSRGETEWAVNVGQRAYREILTELKD